MAGAMEKPEGLAALASLSARVGADALLTQGAGGNTSLKAGGVMWIKASGTLLADALTREIFVPCDLAALRAAMATGDPAADRPALFSLQEGGLRPSIETALHAVFPQAVVVHVHCVNTIAIAVRADAEAELARRLAGEDWAFIPYVKPGAQLARAVAGARGVATDVIVLGNHGLIVAADTVEAAEALLGRIVAALKAAQIAGGGPEGAALAARAGEGFEPLADAHPLHGVAMSGPRMAMALGGSLYPDHVLFCGIGTADLRPGEAPGAAVARHMARGFPPPPILLVAGAGALIRADASAGTRALARCLGDVLVRVPEAATLTYLSVAQNAELLDWDAEKYRLALDAAR